ncbi:hypothetical protein Skr01_37700 [Sphaerisporangium krabiense]|nr:hypothetical protein Skr01_37700 [Sphaerisporangium krabiense]
MTTDNAGLLGSGAPGHGVEMTEPALAWHTTCRTWSSPGAPRREREGCRPASRGLALALMTYTGTITHAPAVLATSDTPV